MKEYCTAFITALDFKGGEVMVLGCEREPHAFDRHMATLKGVDVNHQGKETVITLTWSDPK